MLNIVGQGIPLLVGVVSIPIIASRLGDTRFGILGLVWGILGFFSVFDLGLSRATVKFGAEFLGRGERGVVEQLVSFATLVQTCLGVLGGLVLAMVTPQLVTAVFDVPADVAGETQRAFYLLALSLPFVLLSHALRSVLEAAQRFDLVNLIRVPSSAALFVLPAVGSVLGMRLPGIMLLLLIARVLTCAATAVAIGTAIPGFRWRWPSRADGIFWQLISYGGWVAISNFLTPLFLYLDRFLLASVAGMAAVAYYTAPYEAVTRLLILPAGMGAVLFPAFSTLGIEREPTQGPWLLARAARYVLLLMAAPSALIILFSNELLGVWLGPIYAEEAALALQILTVGVFVNSFAHLLHSYIQGMGRPDLTAKFHLAEFLPYLVLAWVFVQGFGVTGAALAWTIRVIADAALLYAGAWKALGVRPGMVIGGIGGRVFGVVLGFGMALTGARMIVTDTAPLVGLAGVVTVLFAGGVWWLVLDQTERSIVFSAVKGRGQQ